MLVTSGSDAVSVVNRVADESRGTVNHNVNLLSILVNSLAHVEHSQESRAGHEDTVLSEVTTGADSASVSESKVTGVRLIARSDVSLRFKGRWVGVSFRVVKKSPGGGNEVGALGNLVTVVLELFSGHVGCSSGDNRHPSERFLGQGIDIGHLLLIIKVGESFTTGDTVNLFLGLLLNLREGDHGENKAADGRDSSIGTTTVHNGSSGLDSVNVFLGRLSSTLLVFERLATHKLRHVGRSVCSACHLVHNKIVGDVQSLVGNLAPLPSSLLEASTGEPVGEIVKAGNDIDSPLKRNEGGTEVGHHGLNKADERVDLAGFDVVSIDDSEDDGAGFTVVYVD